MTKFQLGLAMGFFLGALVMFVALGIIQLYAEERQEKRAKKQTAWEGGPDASETLFSADCRDPNRLPALFLKERPDEEEIVVCYLFILIE